MGNLFSGKMFSFDFRKTSAWDYQRHLLRPWPTVTVTLHLDHDYVPCGPRLRWFWAIVPFDVDRDYAMWATITVKHKMRPTSQRNPGPHHNGISGPHPMESPAHIDRNTQLQRIAEKEAEKEAASWPQRKPLSDAVEQWLVGMKKPGKSSINAYRSTMRKLLRWAKREGFECVSDVTPGALDAWVGSWAPDAPEKFNRLALTSQAALLKRIKAFFRWACSMKFTAENPTLTITAITTNESQTWPLTPAQFDELMTATYRYDDAAPKESARVGAWLRAIFLVQRWTGLRIGDVVTLPRTALVGNRLSVTIHKKRNVKPKRDNPVPSHMVCVLPDVAVEALLSLPTRREEQDYFFWNHKSLAETNANAWCAKIQKLNRYLSFVDESGQPMPFHSHMLRDMFAVENLKAGVPLEKVSKLLTHESVTITEQYYARWTKGRMQQLEDEAIAAMRRMGAVVTI